MRQLTNVPSSVISSHSMHLGVLATAWHAVNTKTPFTVYYKPRYGIYKYFFGLFFVTSVFFRWQCDVQSKYKTVACLNENRTSPSEFIIPFDQYMESVKTNYSIGMRFKMRFEGEEAPEQRFLHFLF